METIVFGAAALVLLLALWRARAAGAALLSAAGGAAALWAVRLISVKGAAMLAMNAFTLAVSAILGVPGVAGLLLLRAVTAA